MSKINFIIFIINFLQLLEQISLNNIDCNFSFQHLTSLTSIYRCDVKNQVNITSKYSGVITSANGTHEDHKSNDDVACLASYGNKIQYFPQNLQNVFKNLKRISILEGRLKELNQDDLKPFPQLTELHLVDNDIKVLEDGLFEYNLELTLIDLGKNKIIHIGQNVFEGLTKLTFLDIQSNSCIDMKAENNLVVVDKVIGHAKANCTNSEFVALKRGLKALEDEYTYIVAETYEAFNKKVIKFQENFQNSTFMNLSSVSESFNLFLNLNAQPMLMVKKQMKQFEKAMTDSNRNTMKKIEEIEKKPNLMEIASSDLSMWIIAGVIMIIVLILIYRKTLACCMFPIMMI